MNKLRRTVAAGALAAGLLSGCGEGASIEACPDGWNGEAVERPYEVIGVTSAIGEVALAEMYKIPSVVDGAVVEAYVDGGLHGNRNNADELGEVFCRNEDETLSLSAHGAMLIQVAANAEMPEAEELEQYLPYQG